MDASRFDALTKSVASSSSRRQLLAGLAGSALGLIGVRSADARVCSEGGVICRENASCCSHECAAGGDRRRRCTCEIGQTACGARCCRADQTCVNGACRTSDLLCGAGGACTVFLSSTSFTGDLAGLTGADAKCQALADAAILPGTYKAWLSDDTDSPSTRFFQSTSLYRLIDGTVIAQSWTDLTDGTLLAPITIDENGVSNSDLSLRAWTHTLADGTPGGVLDETCGNWTSASNATDGDEGQPAATSDNWTDFASGTCNNQFRLYCFQQSA